MANNIWKFHVDWTETFFKNNENIFVSNYLKKPVSNPWDCNVHAHGTDSKDFNDEELDDINFSFLWEEYTKISKQFLVDNNIFCDCSVYSVWYNIYFNGQFQEPHDHEGHYAGVHFVNYTEGHPTIAFEDSNVLVPNISQGDLIIFPSNLVHYVEKNNTQEPRLTIAFGINLC